MNKTKLGNNSASNFSSSSDLETWVGPSHTSFPVSITKTHSRYPINLNDQTRKIWGKRLFTFKPVRYRRICVFNSADIASQEYYEILPRCLSRLPFFTSRTKEKEEKLRTENARCACVARLASSRSFGETSFDHKLKKKCIKIKKERDSDRVRERKE